jgi:hypothetical protein
VSGRSAREFTYVSHVQKAVPQHCGGGCEWFTDVGCWSVDDVFPCIPDIMVEDSSGEFWAISDLWRSLGDLLKISRDLWRSLAIRGKSPQEIDRFLDYFQKIR